MRVWKVLISHPDDVKDSVSTVKRAVHLVNELLAAFRVPLILNCRSWIDVTPDVHAVSVQQKLEEDLGFDACDVVIGLFWKRLGAKKRGEKSGCERELQIALDARADQGGPHILTYFNQQMAPPASGSVDAARNQLWLAKFKKHLRQSNVQTADYNGDRELENLLVKHLTQLAAGVSYADEKLKSKVRGKIIFGQTDFRGEAGAELVREVEFRFELPEGDPDASENWISKSH